jgi:hypothetical protein
MLKKSRTRKSPKRSMRKSRARKSRARKSRARKSPIRKRSIRKSRARKSPIRKRSMRKSRVRKSPLRKRSMRKSRVRKSPLRKRSIRKRSMCKSRARKSRKCKKSQFRSRKSGYCRKRKCGSGRTRDIVTRLCRNKKRHKSIKRKSIRYKSSHNYSPRDTQKLPRDTQKFERIVKLVVEKDKEKVFNYFTKTLMYNPAIQLADKELEFQEVFTRQIRSKKFLYRCITHEHLEAIKRQGYMTSLSHMGTRSQDVSVSRWIVFGKSSQYASASLHLHTLKEYPICEPRPYIISINIQMLIAMMEIDIIIPLSDRIIEQNTSNTVGTVYTQFKNINNPMDGILDLRSNELTNNKLYLYPAYDKEIVRRWISGMGNLGQSGERNKNAASTVKEVVFCGNIPLSALKIVQEKGKEVDKEIVSLVPPVVQTKSEEIVSLVPPVVQTKSEQIVQTKSDRVSKKPIKPTPNKHKMLAQKIEKKHENLNDKRGVDTDKKKISFRYRMPSDDDDDDDDEDKMDSS